MSAVTTAAPPGAAAQSPKRHKASYQWSARSFGAPAILIVAVLLYLPFIYTAYVSFTEYNGLASPSWLGLDNYREMFADTNLLTSLRNTIIWVVGTITVPVGLGLLVAVVTYNMRFGSWFRLPFLIPYAISGVAVGVVWSFVLQTGGGLPSSLVAAGTT